MSTMNSKHTISHVSTLKDDIQYNNISTNSIHNKNISPSVSRLSTNNNTIYNHNHGHKLTYLSEKSFSYKSNLSSDESSNDSNRKNKIIKNNNINDQKDTDDQILNKFAKLNTIMHTQNLHHKRQNNTKIMSKMRQNISKTPNLNLFNEQGNI